MEWGSDTVFMERNFRVIRIWFSRDGGKSYLCMVVSGTDIRIAPTPECRNPECVFGERSLNLTGNAILYARGD
jgi:hypothetical protein